MIKSCYLDVNLPYTERPDVKCLSLDSGKLILAGLLASDSPSATTIPVMICNREKQEILTFEKL